VSRDELSRRQADLVAALTGRGPVPPGFDPDRVRAASQALLRKRAADAAAAWPLLRADLGPKWMEVFTAYAAGRPAQSALHDGWEVARLRRDALGPAARAELAEREADRRWRWFKRYFRVTRRSGPG
jgi:hypothetical protein